MVAVIVGGGQQDKCVLVAEIRAKPSGIGADVEMGVAGHGRVVSKRSPTLGGL